MAEKSRKKKLIQRKKQKFREFQRRLEIEGNLVYLEAMRFELKHAKNHYKMQKRIYNRPHQKEYVR